MSQVLVKVDQLNYTYPDGFKAIEDISFQIAEGEKIGIIGANGAGKSTLLLLLCGLAHSHDGVIHINGIQSTPKNFRQIAQSLGVVFQNADDQLFSATVFEDVLFGPIQSGLDATLAEQMTGEALRKTGIEHLKDRSPQKLSGGEKRSAAIATAIVMDPPLLILDEPTTGLDPRARRGLIQLLNELKHTQIITSHDLDFIRATCGRVLFLSGGKLIADGETQVLLSDEEALILGGL